MTDDNDQKDKTLEQAVNTTDAGIEQKRKRGRPPIMKNAFENILEAIGNTEAYGLGAVVPFPEKYYVAQLDNGERILLRRDKEDVVRHVSDNALISTILWYCGRPKIKRKIEMMLEPRHAKMLMEIWKANAPSVRLDEIPYLREWQNPGICFARIPWKLEPGPTPIFDELFGRISNATALKTWIGALLDEKSPNQQYAYLFGHGGNGKSSLITFLGDLFGQSYIATEIPNQHNNRFWTSALIGKRLVAFPDCTTPNFVKSGVMKRLTGSDSVGFEIKNSIRSSHKFNCKFIFSSNDMPEIVTSASDERRIILCEFDHLPLGTRVKTPAQYGRELWEEGKHFLHECKERYRAFENEGIIATDAEVLGQLIQDSEENFMVLFEEYFRVDLNMGFDGCVKPKTFNYLLTKEKKMASKDISKFKGWMERKFGIKTFRKFKGERIYKGLVLNEETKQNFQGLSVI